MKNKIILAFILAAASLGAKVTTEHNSYYESLYDYMSPVFDRVAFPIEWFPDRIVSKESQANMAALYAMSEVAGAPPVFTNAPSNQAYSFTATGMYEPIKQRDISGIAGAVSDLSERNVAFAYSAGDISWTPWCFNPKGAGIFSSVSPAGRFGKISDSSMRSYTGEGIGLAGKDFNWENIVGGSRVPEYNRTVARKFVSLCNASGLLITNVVLDTSSAPTDIVDLYRWAQGHSTTIAPWESTMTMQRAWLWNVAPIVAAHNTFFWYVSGSIFDTTWYARMHYKSASLDTEKIREAIINYQIENPDPEKWADLNVGGCVYSYEDDTGEVWSRSTNMMWSMSKTVYAEGGRGITFRGPSSERYIGSVSLVDLTNPDNLWVDHGFVQIVPSTTNVPFRARKFSTTIGSPMDLSAITMEQESGAGAGSGSFYWQYDVPAVIWLTVGSTPFGSINDGFAADKRISNKSCYTVLYLAHQAPGIPTPELYAGSVSVKGNNFYDTLRSFSTTIDTITSTGLGLKLSIPNEDATWDTDVEVDMKEWITSGEIDTLEAYYFEDVGDEEVLDVYRIMAGDMYWIPNQNLALGVRGRELRVKWKNNFGELKTQYNSSAAHVYTLNMFGAVVVPGLLSIK